MNNKKVRYALIVFICASLIALSLAIYLNTGGGDTKKKGGGGAELADGDSVADEIIRNVVYTSIGGEGKGGWTLKALSGVRRGEVLALRDVDLVYTATKDDEAKYTLSGDSGSFDESLGRVGFKGDVQVVAPGGETLETPRLDYIVSDRTVTTEDVVAFSLNDGISVEGSGFEMDFESGRFIVKRDVRAVVRDGAI
jgi:LPS export ABC transporter protein LptC